MNYRAQGAIEYLLIIGAAILIVAIVILAATGILFGGQTQAATSGTQSQGAVSGLRSLAYVSLGGHDYIKSDPIITSLTNVWRLDESGGSTFSDEVGSIIGTCASANCPSHSTGVAGNAALFSNSSSDQFIQIPNLPTSNNETYAMWFNVSASGAVSSFILVPEEDGNNPDSFWHYRGQLYVDPSNKVHWNVGSWGGDQTLSKCDPSDSSGGYVIQLISTKNISLNSWHFAVLTVSYRPFSASLYLDGEYQDKKDTSFNCTSDMHIAWLGRRKSINGALAIFPSFSGNIDEFSIWNRVLSSTEISELYANAVKK